MHQKREPELVHLQNKKQEVLSETMEPLQSISNIELNWNAGCIEEIIFFLQISTIITYLFYNYPQLRLYEHSDLAVGIWHLGPSFESVLTVL